MTKQFYCFVLFLSIFLLAEALSAKDDKYNYISAKNLENRLTAKMPTNIVDIQVEDEFTQHHIKGAEPTYAYPVKTDSDRAKLEKVVQQIYNNNDPVIIVCPRGAGGAERTYEYLLKKGIPDERLMILEKGQEGWTCAPLTESR
ncbi:MAG: rhodanese-like domain-containing protein [Deltaproteobacteria bacterium]|jgi:rhodanese-related sulfurtransferase|nr:rhodanese-like domain-containing protein [Deltaproteobacteria bacterium]